MFSNSKKFIECPICLGSGIIQRYPYYAKKMPSKIKMNCNMCNGLGIIEEKIIEENNFIFIPKKLFSYDR